MSERENIAALYKTLDGEDQQTPILALILDRQDTIIDKLSKFESELAGHMQREEAMLKQLENAFPKKSDGKPDVEGHRDYHTSLIEEAKGRAQLWRDLRGELVKKGIMGLVAVLAFLVVYWWNGEIKK